MKLPKTFLPNKINEEKTEQLLVEPKIIERGPTEEDIKENLLENLVTQLELKGQFLGNDLTKTIGNTLESLGYSKFISSDPESEYWTKKTSEGCKVFFKSNFGKKLFGLVDEYGFAYLKDEKCFSGFQKRFEKYADRERKRHIGFLPYKSLEYKIGAASSAVAATILAGVYFYNTPVELILGKLQIQSFLCIISIMYSYLLGGLMTYRLSHKINKSKMEKLCTNFTLDEKEALRYAILEK